MDEQLEAKAVEQIRLRTAANFLAAFTGMLIPLAVLCLYKFIFDLDTFLTYHNEPQGSMLLEQDRVDTGYMIFCGITGGAAAAAIAVLAVLFFKRFRRIDNKATQAVVSAVVTLLCIPAGYFLMFLLFT